MRFELKSARLRGARHLTALTRLFLDKLRHHSLTELPIQIP